MTRVLTFAFAFALPLATALAAAGGCSKSSDKPSEAAIAPAAVKEASKVFTERCTSCHGRFGRGDGPASAALTPRPRNFAEVAWQRSVTDEHLEKIIVYGGAGVGKSAAMPANPDLDGKPELVKALRAHVRGLSK